MAAGLRGFRLPREPLLQFHRSDTSQVAPTPVEILNLGAFDRRTEPIRVAVLVPESLRMQVEHLLHVLNTGERSFRGGAPRIFGCTFQAVHWQDVDLTLEDGVERACEALGGRLTPDGADVVLAYAPVFSRTDLKAPYNRMKVRLANLGFASQVVSDETLQNPSWKLLNLGLGMFVKAGRIPWVLRDPLADVDMFIGVEMSHRVLVTGERTPRYVAFANVFDEFGRWQFMDGASRPVTMPDRHRALAEMLRRTVDRFVGLTGTEPRSIVIHYFKRISRQERGVVLRTLQERLGQFSVALIALDDTHGLRVYDETNPKKDVARGQVVILREGTDRYELLVSTTGYSAEASRNRKMGTPVLLKAAVEQYPQPFLSPADVAYQVVALTKLNWGTVEYKVREPITLGYARRLAYLTSMVDANDWSSMLASATLRSRPWFV